MIYTRPSVLMHDGGDVLPKGNGILSLGCCCCCMGCGCDKSRMTSGFSIWFLWRLRQLDASPTIRILETLIENGFWLVDLLDWGNFHRVSRRHAIFPSVNKSLWECVVSLNITNQTELEMELRISFSRTRTVSLREPSPNQSRVTLEPIRREICFK